VTKLLEQALEAARSVSPDAQDDIARVVLRLAGTDEEPPVTLSPEEWTPRRNPEATRRADWSRPRKLERDATDHQVAFRSSGDTSF
jgi:hypothetical protein